MSLSLSLSPSPPVLWLFPTRLPYLSLLQLSGTCLPAFLQACVSHSPQLPGLIPHCHWKTGLGLNFINLEDVTHAQSKACF